jgi:DNA-binding MarR family transcriptional regulator
MATWRRSRLQQRILHGLAMDSQRTQGRIVRRHENLSKALREEKSNISRSLRTLEGRGWSRLGRSPGGKAQHVTLTAEGAQRASEITKKL